MTRISAAEADELLRAFEREWFRYESRDSYADADEQPELDAFLAGSPRQPDEVGWWRDWLAQAADLTQRQHKKMSRVRLVGDDGPTDYQRWQIWSAPWYAQAGITIRYLGRRRAAALGLPPDGDWSLLDRRQVIIHEYSATGTVTGWELITGTDAVARYTRWRDTALASASFAAPGRAA